MRNDCDLPYVRWEDFQGSDIYLLVFQLLGLHSLCYVQSMLNPSNTLNSRDRGVGDGIQ